MYTCMINTLGLLLILGTLIYLALAKYRMTHVILRLYHYFNCKPTKRFPYVPQIKPSHLPSIILVT